MLGSFSENQQPNKVIFNSAYQLLITGNEDKEIKFFDLRTGSYTDGITGHSDAVSALDSNGNNLYSGGHEGNLRLWDLRKRECLFDLNAH